MSPRTRIRRLGLSRILLLLSFSFAAAACGHTQAAPPNVPMDVVMQVIHNYGQGHHGRPLSIPASPPDESTATYDYRIQSLLTQRDYAQLEQTAQTNRTERGLLIGGYWKIHEFYAALQSPLGVQNLTDADYKRQIEAVGQWLAARPDSAAARIELAGLYVSYAGYARGSGYADTVSDRQWELYRTRTAQAKQVLVEAANLKDRDAEWYMMMEYVASNEGWDNAHARELFDQALTFEPSFYHYFRPYSDYLLPRWYGQPGDIQALADEVSARNADPTSSISYFQIMSALACYCSGDMAEMKNADWSKLKLGFANLDRYYGTTDLNANRYALMAVVFEDKPAASEAFHRVVNRSPMVWLSEDDYNGVRAWAIAGEQ